MPIGLGPFLLLLAGGIAYILGIARRMNVEGISVVAALCISTFVVAAVFCRAFLVSPLTVFAAQIIGALIYTLLLRFAFGYAAMGRRGLFDRSVATRSRLIRVLFLAPAGLIFLDYLPIAYGHGASCSSVRCALVDAIVGYDRSFQVYYLTSWLGILIIFASISSTIQLIRFKK